MGLSLAHQGQSVFLDTAPLIYLFEEHEQFLPAVQQVLDKAYAMGVQLASSMVTYAEILTLPTREGDRMLAARYREFLTKSDGLSVYRLNITVADEAVRLRAELTLRTPDAIQLGHSLPRHLDPRAARRCHWTSHRPSPIFTRESVGRTSRVVGDPAGLDVPPGGAQREATTPANSGRTCDSRPCAAGGMSIRPELDWQRYSAGSPPERPGRPAPPRKRR